MFLYTPINVQGGLTKRTSSTRCLGWQAGAVMVEMVASLTLVGSAAALALTHQQTAQDLALQTHAQLTASAISSAVNLQQAKWVVSRNPLSPLYFGNNGIAMGLDANPTATEQDCKALWQQLVQPQPTMKSAHNFWRAAPEGANSVRCQFTYHHHNLPTVVVFYNTQTGLTAFE